MTSQSNFEQHFNSKNQILSQDNRIKIRERAEAWAKSFIDRHDANDYLYLYRIGGLYYFAPSRRSEQV